MLLRSYLGAEKDDKNSKSKNGRKNRQSARKTKEPTGKSIMIRLYPNKSQKEDLNKLFGTAK
jgi:hypothetical protein